MAKIYALYKGDEYIADGTLEELAEKTGLKKSSLKWMKTPSGKRKRSSLVCIGEEEQTRRCELCGKAFCTNNPSQKYCSVACRTKAKRIREREKYREKCHVLFAERPEEERKRTCVFCGESFVANTPKQKYCSKICCKRENNKKQARNSVVRLELPYKRHKPKYVSHIEEINARARAQHKSYGQLQAEKLLARLHEEMAGGVER